MNGGTEMHEVCADARELIDALGLVPLAEGGWFCFTAKSGVCIPQDALPAGYPGERESCSLIYYLLQGDEVSRWHQLRAPELWLWHAGGTLQMTLGGMGERPVAAETLLIGPGLVQGERFQAVVPAGTWQTTRLLRGEFALVSCVVSPAYEDEDCYMPEL